jgi:NAD(P)-dependent dehydrogenase (short-subunit alcohol dehydrogenase family)
VAKTVLCIIIDRLFVTNDRHGNRPAVDPAHSLSRRYRYRFLVSHLNLRSVVSITGFAVPATRIRGQGQDRQQHSRRDRDCGRHCFRDRGRSDRPRSGRRWSHGSSARGVGSMSRSPMLSAARSPRRYRGKQFRPGPLAACRGVDSALSTGSPRRSFTVGSVAGAAPSADGGYAHYGAAKAAIAHCPRYLAQDLGPFGITVKCIAAGVILIDGGLVWGEQSRQRSSKTETRSRRYTLYIHDTYTLGATRLSISY